jgi:hypothetical protein
MRLVTSLYVLKLPISFMKHKVEWLISEQSKLTNHIAETSSKVINLISEAK